MWRKNDICKKRPGKYVLVCFSASFKLTCYAVPLRALRPRQPYFYFWTRREQLCTAAMWSNYI
jgi:hypothetical protein